MTKQAIKCKENQLPGELRVHVIHLHEGNSTRRQRKGRKYATLASIIGPTGDVVGVGEAYCSNNDSPRRDIGRQVAVGRAIKSYYSEVADTLGV